VTDDRQTDHATEKCVAIGRIACAARSIQPNNNDNLASICQYMYVKHAACTHCAYNI